MKKLQIVMIVFTTLILLGCSSKTQVEYIKPKPFKFKTTPQPKVRDIRVYKADKKLYKAYILHFRKIIDFHNKQIQDYYDSFDANTTKGE